MPATRMPHAPRRADERRLFDNSPRSSLALSLLVLFLLLPACDAVGEGEPEPVEVTLLIVYTSDARAAAGDIEQYFQQSIAQTNETYANSAVELRLRIVHMQEVDYQVTERLEDLKRLLSPEDGYLDDVHQWRDTYEADLVAFVPNNRSSTINAAIMATEETAFVVVHWEHTSAPDYGLAHEIGHLFGARHTPDSDGQTMPFPYGHGFRNDSLRTIMANGPQQRVPYYSGPDQRYEGVVLGDTTLQNVAQVLREAAVYISNFRGPQTETSFEPPGTWPVVSIE